MTDTRLHSELDLLQRRIDVSAPEQRDALQRQLDDLKRNLDAASAGDEATHDAEVEQLFDNMPV